MNNQNFVQPGRIIGVTAPYARASSGLGLKVGGLFGVTMDAVAENAQGQIEREGVHTLAKTAAQAWTQGQRLFWDDTNKRVDSDPTVGMFIGAATEAAENPSSTGKVLLIPSGPLLEGAQAAQADVATADGSDPATTQALANALKVAHNALLAKLRLAGIIAP